MFIMHYVKTILYIVLVGSILLALLEKTLRNNDVQSHLLIPSLDMNDYVLAERQIDGLEKMQQKYGKLECIIIGSSISATAIHPTYLDEAYYQYTGEHFYCYNFSLLGVQASAIEPIAHYLIAKYQPRYFIYGISPIALTEYENDANRLIQNSAWFDYLKGDVTPQGWLIEHSYLERYYLRYKVWLNHSTSAKYEEIKNWGTIHDETGYLPGFQSAIDVELPPNAERFASDAHMLNKVIANYKLSETKIASFTKLVEEASGNDTQLIIMDMPLHSSFPSYYQEGGLQHTDYLDAIKTIAQSADIPVWTLSTVNIVPNELWRDRHHLSPAGTVYFSNWLAIQLDSVNLKNPANQTVLASDFANVNMDLVELLPNFGLSDTDWLEYQTYIADRPLIQGIVLHPEPCPNANTIAMSQINIGFALSLKKPPLPQRQRDYHFINLLDNIVCADNLNLSVAETEQLAQWSLTGDPELLDSLPIDYLVYSDTWQFLQSEIMQQQLDDAEKYKLVRQYTTPISAKVYYVVSPLRGE